MRDRFGRSGRVAALAVVLIGTASCGTERPGGDSVSPPGSPVGFDPADERLAPFATTLFEPVALVALPDGGLLVAERLSGRVRSISAGGIVAADPVAEVEVVGSEDDQRGLVGLARLADGRIVASWTRVGDGRLVVGEVGAGPEPRVIWVGPESADRANGGSLVVLADGMLVVGIGDLLADAALADDPDAPNRKLLVLDPDGAADQDAQVMSAGWNNPFALVVENSGRLRVADNSGGDAPERLGFGDRPAAASVDLAPPGLAPSGLIDLGDDRLGLCSYLRDELVEIDTSTDTPRLTGRVVASPCRTAVERLADGRVVTASDQLWVSAGRLDS